MMKNLKILLAVLALLAAPVAFIAGCDDDSSDKPKELSLSIATTSDYTVHVSEAGVGSSDILAKFGVPYVDLTSGSAAIENISLPIGLFKATFSFTEAPLDDPQDGDKTVCFQLGEKAYTVIFNDDGVPWAAVTEDVGGSSVISEACPAE